MSLLLRWFLVFLLVPGSVLAESKRWLVGPDAWVAGKSRPSLVGYAPIDPGQVGVDTEDPLGRRVVKNRLVLMLKAGADPTDLIAFFNRKYRGEALSFVGLDPQTNALQAEVPPEAAPSWKERLGAHPLVEGVFFEQLLKTQLNTGDPVFETKGDERAWPWRRMGLPQAWERTLGRPAVTIAVIDSGFDPKHPELAGRVRSVWNAASRTQRLEGSRGLSEHGTHVASLAGGRAGNRLGAAGACPGCSLLLIQASDRAGNLSMSSVANGIYYALYKGAKVINLSLGFFPSGSFGTLSEGQKRRLQSRFLAASRGEVIFWQRLFKAARDKGAVVVQAAGNDNYLAQMDPMKRAPGSLVIGALDQSGNRASFSNYGPEVDLSAPGVGVYGALPGGRFEARDGTSMAAPLVAGTLGLMFSAEPGLTPRRAAEILRQTAQSQRGGQGRQPGALVRADLALEALGGVAPPPSAPSGVDCGPRIERLEEENQRLRREIEELKERLSRLFQVPAGADPKETKGLWAASKTMVNQDQAPVRLFFQFDGNGGGKVVYQEARGQACLAPLRTELSKGVMVIEQTQDAPCLAKGRSYKAYRFRCRNQGVKGAICHLDRSQRATPFRLFRSKLGE